MTRRSLFQRAAACFVGSVLAKTPFVAAAVSDEFLIREAMRRHKWNPPLADVIHLPVFEATVVKPEEQLPPPEVEPERIAGWHWIDVTPKQHPSFNIDPVYRKFVLVHDEYAPWP